MERKSKGKVLHLNKKKISKILNQQLKKGSVQSKVRSESADAPRKLESQEEQESGWDLTNHSPNITVLDGHTVQRNVGMRQSTDGAIARSGYKRGIHAVTFRFSSSSWGTHCSVGVCTKDNRTHKDGYGHLLGQDEISWALDLPTKRLLNNGQVAEIYNDLDGMMVGKYIVMIMDLEQGHLYFTCRADNMPYQLIYSHKGLKKPKAALHPAISMVYGGMQCTINVTSAVNEPEICENFVKELTIYQSSHSRSSVNRPTTILKHSSQGHYTTDTTETGDEAYENQNSTTIYQTKLKKITGFKDINSSANDGAPKKNNSETSKKNPSNEIDSTDKDLKDKDSQLNSNNKNITNETKSKPRKSHNNRMSSRKRSEKEELKESSDENGDQATDAAFDKSIVHTPDSLDYQEQHKLNHEELNIDSIITAKDEVIQTEDDSEIFVEDLPLEDQDLLRLAHGWDRIHRGGHVVPYPNAPYICVPMPHLFGSIQGIRGSRGFTNGSHRWSISELQFYSPTMGSRTNKRPVNDLLIGVVTSDHRVFNFGGGLHGIGQHAWCYRPRTGQVWHSGQSSCMSRSVDEASSDSKELEDINLPSNNYEFELCAEQKVLIVYSLGREVARVTDLQGSVFYPIVIFHVEGHAPVEFSYLSGPTSHIKKVLSEVRSLSQEERADSVLNYRPLMKRSTSFYLSDVADVTRMNSYHWALPIIGSTGVKMGPPNAAILSLEARLPIFLWAKWELIGAPHKVQWTFNTTNVDFVIGIAASRSSEGTSEGLSGKMEMLGASSESWGWNVRERRLYHAGRPIAKYPVLTSEEYDKSSYRTYRMTVSRNPLGSHVVSFEAISTKTGHVIELGVAFINVARRLVPSVVVLNRGRSSPEYLQVHMEYYSGTWKQPQSAESATCVIS